MFDLRKLVVLFVVSVLSLSGAVQAASGSDGKGSDKHSSSDNKKSSNDKDQESSSGETKKVSNDDKQGLSDGTNHLSLKDDGHTPSGGGNKDSWDGKVFGGGDDFNPSLGHGGEHWNDYLTSSIPEPETYAMLLAGLSLLGFLSRRKKKDV